MTEDAAAGVSRHRINESSHITELSFQAVG